MRTVVITGASRGIGRATALRMAKGGNVRLGLLARTGSKLESLKEEIHSTAQECEVHILPIDLGRSEAIEQLSSWVDEYLGSVDILINNAGAITVKPFHEMTFEDYSYIYNVNVWGVVAATKSILAARKESKENPLHVVNISSMGGVGGSAKFPGLSLYSSSKGALNILTECLAEEYKEDQVKVNCLALGAAQTEMLEEAFPGYEADMSPEGMAEYISWFSREGWKYHNGKCIHVAVSTP